MRKERLIGLDMFRVLSVLFIFLFHSNIHIGCDYSLLTKFISMGAIFMTAFFLLSGYSLFTSYNNLDLSNIEILKCFYLKRIITILPLYYFASILFIIIFGNETPLENLLLAPLEILGLQSTISGIIPYTHNGGTWFVSCILICYLVYPLIQIVIVQISTKYKVILLFICTIALLSAPIIINHFDLSSIYINPFFRLQEFLIGIILCSLFNSNKFLHALHNVHLFIISLSIMILLILLVTFAIEHELFINDYMMYNWIVLPLFSILLITLACIKKSSESNTHIIEYLSKISYACFFAQFFTWSSTTYILSHLNISSNILKIVCSFFICMIYTIVLHEAIEKPWSKLLGKKLISHP